MTNLKTSDENKLVLFVARTFLERIVSHCVFFALLVSTIGLGVWLSSSAMQWVGAFVFFLWCIASAKSEMKCITIEEARKKLDEFEARQKKSRIE